MTRRLLVSLLALCVFFTIIHGKSDCTCTCCGGNRCVSKYQGSINMLTCSGTSCKRMCKVRYPGQCSRSPGSITATCTKTKTPARVSPVKKIKQKLTPSSNKPYRRP